MKKLLALLLTMLVIGSAYSGPIHINGPGVIPGITIDEVSDITVAIEPIYVSSHIDFCTAHVFQVSPFEFGAQDIAGVNAGDCRGIYNNVFSGKLVSTDSLVFPVTTPDIEQVFYGADSQAQEVMPLAGSKNRAAVNTAIIII